MYQFGEFTKKSQLRANEKEAGSSIFARSPKKSYSKPTFLFDILVSVYYRLKMLFFSILRIFHAVFRRIRESTVLFEHTPISGGMFSI
jgi:hypothetical protein